MVLRTTRFASLLALAGGALLLGCGDDASDGTGASAASGPTGSGGGPTSSSSGNTGGATSSAEAAFTVRIENVSGNASIVTAISPGVWVVHATPDPLFSEGAADRNQGLERIAEDGKPAVLDASLVGTIHGVYEMPEGADEPGAIKPGGAFQFEVKARADTPYLSFASMFGNSNDVFLAPSGDGIHLFDETGVPIAAADVSASVMLWDAGTEVNEAPNSGPVQAPRQGEPDTGPREGVLGPFVDSTRALPSAWQIAHVDVVPAGDGFDVTITNVSGPGSAAVTPISPVFYALHNENWSLFQTGTHASAGIEAIAEDGNPAVLLATESGAVGVAAAGISNVPDGASAPGAAKPGQSFSLHLTPTANARFFSIASMFGQSNDVYLAFGPEGVALLDEQGAPRPAADIAADLSRQLVLWDAGTEANEVPGAGPNQAPRQSAPNTGPADPDATVRRYGDATNDLAGPMAGGLARVSVESLGGNVLAVTVSNKSAETAYPTKLSPVAYAVHDGTYSFFTDGSPSPSAIERLAEDGNPTEWANALTGAPGVGASGKFGDGPIASGESFVFMITVTPDARVLDLATMIGTSNDTFLNLGPMGVVLADTQGDLRPVDAINADLDAALSAWDAGTEANQAAALGPDQAPRQAAPNTGAPEGSGLVRMLDQVWAFPKATDVIRVTVTPVE